MNLPVDPVRSMEDATLNFEAIQALGVLGSIIGANVQANVGTVTLTWAASNTSSVVNVPHGLRRVPKAIFTQPIGNLTLQAFVGAAGASTFPIQGYTTNGSTITTTLTFYWLAIG